MPDHDLDTRIRALVADAVADAPAPPDLDDLDVVAAPVRRPDHRRWWIGGAAAALATAAAVVAVVVLGDGGEESVTTPATTPTTVPATPPGTVAPTTVAPTPTSTTPPAAVGTAQLLAVAGSDTITITDREGRPLETIDQAADVAWAVGDGRVVFQRQGGASAGLAPGDTDPQVWVDGQVTPLALAAEDTEYVEVHDIAFVDGRPLVLWTTFGSDANPETYGDVRLWVAQLSQSPSADGPYTTGPPTDLGVVGGWEAGVSRLHLATDGLIVGTYSESVVTSLYLAAVPGTPAAASAATLTPAALGLEDRYEDCADCPSAFTIDSAGETIAWVSADGLTRVPLSGGVPGSSVTEPFTADRTGVESLELLDDGGVAVTYLPSMDPRPPATLVRDGATSELPGLTVTEAPNTGGATTPGPGPGTPTSTSPTTTTAPPATSTTVPAGPAGVRYVTAGPAGIVITENGQEVRRLDQPAALALLTPGGSVIFQAPASDETTSRLGAPQIWRADGTVENLLAELPAEQWYRLHDLAVIDGVPTLLYGVRTDPDPIDPLRFTEVITALRMEPGSWTTDQLDTVATWEGGVSRLSLSDDGLVVGTHSELVSTAYYADVVPGSPAAADEAARTARPAGVEESYSECGTCPNHFTVSGDGESIVWHEAARLVVVDVATGERMEWEAPALAPTDTFVGGIDARTSSDGGVELIVTYRSLDGSPAPDAVGLATTPPGDVVETPLGAPSATFGP